MNWLLAALLDGTADGVGLVWSFATTALSGELPPFNLPGGDGPFNWPDLPGLPPPVVPGPSGPGDDPGDGPPPIDPPTEPPPEDPESPEPPEDCEE